MGLSRELWWERRGLVLARSCDFKEAVHEASCVGDPVPVLRTQ